MNSKVVLTLFIFAIKFNSIFGQISCNYSITSTGYACHLVINNPNGLYNFVSIGGTHLSGYTDSHVKEVMSIFGSITTNIPSIICSKFRNIQKITLKEIGITRIDEYSFTDCALMEVLSLTHNQISAVHEKALMNLNLRSLYLNNNHLTTLPENVFQNQQNLRILWLRYNNIADLPAHVFRPLTSLTSLDFGSNQIKAIRNEWFEPLQNLIYLDMPYNFITDIPKNAFTPLKNMKKLEIYANQLKIIHGDSFGYLPTLEVITLNMNQVNEIDEKLVDNTGIIRIIMTRNICATNDINDNSISRDFMRAELRECFDNYEKTMSVCRQHSEFLKGAGEVGTQTCKADKQSIQEMKEEWEREREELIATVRNLTEMINKSNV